MKNYIFLIIMLVLITGCSTYGSNSSIENPTVMPVDNSGLVTSPIQNIPPQDPIVDNKQVVIKDFKFTPDILTVKVGTIITWVNEDSVSHIVKFEGFESESLQTGESFSHTFDAVGAYAYHCAIHPSMKGTIIVE